MIDLHLQAATEADLIAALPMLRGTDDEGHAVWLTSGPHHALDLAVPIVVTPAVIDAEGKVTTAAVLDGRYHANLRLADDHPARDTILAAAAPFVVTPTSPRRAFL